MEVTVHVATERILRIRGYPHHNALCQDAVLTAIPSQALHPTVYQRALAEMTAGIPYHQIRANNRTAYVQRSYPDMNGEPHTWQHRYLILPGDRRSLNRQATRLKGIKVTEKPHINIDEWLEPDSPNYKKELAEAVFHYSPRVEKGERLELCIATQEMNEMAWKHAYRSQVLMDGTFGICDKKMLLFIMMGIDDDGHGVPLAFLLFSAPSGNRQTSAGYDTEVLTRLLREWRSSLEKHRNGQSFYCLVGVTDTDLKERAALLDVFTEIILLICRVHLRRSWQNHRSKHLKAGKGDLETRDIILRLRRLEDDLVKTVNFEEAVALVEAEREILTDDIDNDGILSGAIKHLDYLAQFWLKRNLWESWSDFGRHAAAKVINCPLEKVISTTNHLESFNSVLKHHFIASKQSGGRRLRLDMLFYHLVSTIMPVFFETRLLARLEEERKMLWVKALPGGKRLWEEMENRRLTKRILKPVAFVDLDDQRENAGREIMMNRQISAPTPTPHGMSFTCYSSLTLVHDDDPTLYNIFLSYNGLSSCSCPDFTNRGGLCKHMRAALLTISCIRLQQQLQQPVVSPTIQIPDINIPRSEEEARLRAAQLDVYELQRAEIVPVISPMERAALVLDDLLDATEGSPAPICPSRASSTHGSSHADDDSASDLSEEDGLHLWEASSDLDSEEHNQPVTVIVPEPSSSKAGLQQQVAQRALYDIVPTLNDLTTILTTPLHTDTAPQVMDLANQLEAIVVRLRAASIGATPIVPPTAAVSAQVPRDGPRILLPPSPEKRQYRKNSYSVW